MKRREKGKGEGRVKLFISLFAYKGLKQEHIEPAREHAIMHVPYIDKEVQTWQ